MAKLDKDLLSRMYKKMWEIRHFEQTIYTFFSKGIIHGTCHLSVGEEGTAVGTIFALKKNDYVHGNHRGHGHALAADIPVREAMAEIFGKSTGVCKGRGGSMHICDAANGYLGANGILGASMPISVGAALAVKMQGKKDTVVCCIYGDGSSNQGAAHEAMNLAALWKLPIIFVCVNNLYGMSLPVAKGCADPDLEKRGYPYGIKSTTIDGNDVLKVYETVSKARDYVLKNEKPMYIVEMTYRWLGHAKMDAQKYRTKEEVEEWKKKCPIKRLGEYMIKEGMATQEDLDKWNQEAMDDVQDALKFAQESEYLPAESVLDDVYAK